MLSGYVKRTLTEKLSNGYKKLSFWTNANTVEFADGLTAETKVGGIDGITSSLSSTDDNGRIAVSFNLFKRLYNKLNTGTYDKLYDTKFYPSALSEEASIVSGSTSGFTANLSDYYTIIVMCHIGNYDRQLIFKNTKEDEESFAVTQGVSAYSDTDSYVDGYVKVSWSGNSISLLGSSKGSNWSFAQNFYISKVFGYSYK